jgi:predicted membrane protein
MSKLVQAKLALVVMGLIIWVWGYRVDDSFLRIVGIVVLLIAFLLRFIGRRSRAAGPPKDGPPAP